MRTFKQNEWTSRTYFIACLYIIHDHYMMNADETIKVFSISSTRSPFHQLSWQLACLLPTKRAALFHLFAEWLAVYFGGQASVCLDPAPWRDLHNERASCILIRNVKELLHTRCCGVKPYTTRETKNGIATKNDEILNFDFATILICHIRPFSPLYKGLKYHLLAFDNETRNSSLGTIQRN